MIEFINTGTLSVDKTNLDSGTSGNNLAWFITRSIISMNDKIGLNYWLSSNNFLNLAIIISIITKY